VTFVGNLVVRSLTTGDGEQPQFTVTRLPSQVFEERVNVGAGQPFGLGHDCFSWAPPLHTAEDIPRHRPSQGQVTIRELPMPVALLLGAKAGHADSIVVQILEDGGNPYVGSNSQTLTSTNGTYIFTFPNLPNLDFTGISGRHIDMRLGGRLERLRT